MVKRAIGSVISVVLLAAAFGPATAQVPSSGAVAQCQSLERSDFSQVPDAPTQITEAKLSDPEDDIPAYCRVTGYVTPNVDFELRLPKDWNGKFMELGCGGHCGMVGSSECDSALKRGYACLASDMGHRGTGVDGLWAHNNLDARIEWGYRATHVVALAGKAITERYYTRGPSKSYYMGCSTGGRQGLQEAQRFPWDFDGIVAGAPPIRLSDLYVVFAAAQIAARDAQGGLILHKEDLKLLTDSALAKCDLDDGVKDGIIGRPQSCSFQPSEIECRSGQTAACLSPVKVKAAEQIYSGPTDSAGKSLLGRGALPGSEVGWEKYYLDIDGKHSYLYGLTENGFRYLFSSPEFGADWTLKQLDITRDFKRFDEMESLYDSSNPDLSRFKAAGGKLIIYIGMNDISIPQTIIDYYEKVERVMGGQKPTQEFARLFSLPGVDHCAGGPGADTVDYLSYLENWVERGEPPNKLLAYHVKSANQKIANTFPLQEQSIEFSRPIYPYPTTAKYRGHGDPRDATNFGPVTPSQ